MIYKNFEDVKEGGGTSIQNPNIFILSMEI